MGGAGPGVGGCCKAYLSPFTEPIQKEKEERIRNYVQESAPQYRPLLKHRSKELDTIPPNLKDAELDVELYRRSHEYDIELKETASKLFGTERVSGPTLSV